MLLKHFFTLPAILHFLGFFKKVKYGGGDNLTLFSRQTPPVSVQKRRKTPVLQ